MSSSAFTPSTTTVTNNVPVNVPVVTAWESYTPVVTNLISFAGNQYGRYRRVGDSMEVFAHINATGSSSNVITVSIPSGFTIDLTKIPTGSVQTVGTVKALRNGVSIYEGSVETNGTTQVKFYLADSTPQAAGSTTPWTWQSGDHISFYCTVPIAEWSGSGTTTLATRAVEEYAYNTDTTNANNTSSFGYGTDGALFPNRTVGTGVSKQVRFQTPILPTDRITLEYQQAGLGSWREASQIMSKVTANAAIYGAYIDYVSSTDVTVQFAANGVTAFGAATYGANGEQWSAYNSAGWKWRVRKVSSGAQVGYPVSARNIVGDTSGTAVPVGMLGEQVLFTTRSVSAVTPNWVANTSPLITLTPGTWILFPQITGIAAAGLTSVLAFLSTDSNSDSTGNLSLENGAFVLAANATINQSDIPMAMIYLNVTQNTPIYAKARTSGANTTITLKGRAVRIA